jgi:hypothetical protein
MRTSLPVLAALGLSACASVPQNEGAPATVSEVVARIKADINAYQDYDAKASGVPPLVNACRASVGFRIDSVKVSLTTETDNTAAANAGLKLPVGGWSLAPSWSGSSEGKGTQNLTFMLYPKARAPAAGAMKLPASIDAAKFPIAAALQRLRDGLLQASYQAPCLSLVPINSGGVPLPPDKDPGGTYAFGFTVTDTSTVGGTISFTVFSLGASDSAKTTAGNTITVTFKARPDAAAAFQ